MQDEDVPARHGALGLQGFSVVFHIISEREKNAPVSDKSCLRLECKGRRSAVPPLPAFKRVQGQ